MDTGSKSRPSAPASPPDSGPRLVRRKLNSDSKSLQLGVAGLFAGVGGLELGLSRHGHEATHLCEFDQGANAVLDEKFPNVARSGDVQTLTSLPKSTEMITAGFPCQDLSQAGKTAGIKGARSGLVGHVFRLLEQRSIKWVVLENVPFMLHLAKGRALNVIIERLEALGFNWAYRVLDSRAFGVPQRRQRVFLLASRTGDPRDYLLTDDMKPPEQSNSPNLARGFYWTEGTRGLGWAVDAVPTLKGGSTIGIPSPPAVLYPDGRILKPDIRDMELLQGFEPNWTKPSDSVTRPGHRWKLVGNAVTVNVAQWVGKKLANPGSYDPSSDLRLAKNSPWPKAAWGYGGVRAASLASAWPVHTSREPLAEFLKHGGEPLSEKATRGFYSRAVASSLNFEEGFLPRVKAHLKKMEALSGK